MADLDLGPARVRAVVPTLRATRATPPTTPGVRVVPVVGSPGPAGVASLEPYTYVMPVAQTTALIDHTLERNPVAIQVLDESGQVCDEFGVVFTVDRSQIRVSFDVAVRATIRLL